MESCVKLFLCPQEADEVWKEIKHAILLRSAQAQRLASCMSPLIKVTVPTRLEYPQSPANEAANWVRPRSRSQIPLELYIVSKDYHCSCSNSCDQQGIPVTHCYCVPAAQHYVPCIFGGSIAPHVYNNVPHLIKYLCGKSTAKNICTIGECQSSTGLH